MLAAVLRELKKPLSIEDVPPPEPGPGEVQVEIRASGLCSSDLHYMSGASPVGKIPIIPGHEIAGVVSGVGAGVRNAREGDRVAIHYLVSCGRCGYCRSGRENLCDECDMIGKSVDGGFAGYIVVPEHNAVPVPDGIPMEHAALATDAVATPYHAARLSGLKPGDTALILGIGGLGAHAVQLPRIFGADSVIAADASSAKLELAGELGADRLIDASAEDVVEKTMEITGGRGADVVLELIGLKKTLESSVRCLAKGGRMVVVGICPERIEIDSYNDILLKEAVITGNCDHLREELPEILDLMRDGRIDLSRSVSRRIRLSEINEGFNALKQKEGNPVRIVITETA